MAYSVTWYDSDANEYYTETYTNSANWGNKVLIVNMTDHLRLVATEYPE